MNDSMSNNLTPNKHTYISKKIVKNKRPTSSLFMMLIISLFPVFGSYGDIVLKGSIIVCGLYTLICLWYSKRTAVRIALNYPVCFSLFFIYCILTTIWCVNLGSAVVSLRSMLYSYVICISVICFYKHDYDSLLNYFLYGVVIISVFCILKENTSLLVWARLGDEEFTTGGQTLIYYTCLLIWGYMVSVYRMFASKKLIYGVMGALILLCEILTGVRKILFVSVFFTVLFIALKNKKNVLKIILYTGLSIIAAFVIFNLVMKYSTSMAFRINSLIEDITSNVQVTSFNHNMNSYTERKWLRKQAWELFKKYPIFGYGIGQFKIYSISIGGPSLYSHNNFLELLSCTGLIGFIIYYLGIGSIALKSFKIIKRSKNKTVLTRQSFVFAAVISLLIMDYGQVSYYYTMFVAMYTILYLMIRDEVVYDE